MQPPRTHGNRRERVFAADVIQAIDALKLALFAVQSAEAERHRASQQACAPAEWQRIQREVASARVVLMEARAALDLVLG